MKIYRNISTVKAKSVEGNKPTHYLKATESKENKEAVFVASLWAKTWKSPEGQEVKFLSGEMKGQFTDHTNPERTRKGYVIVEEAELNKLLNEVKLSRGEILHEDVSEEDTEEIPF